MKKRDLFYYVLIGLLFITPVSKTVGWQIFYSDRQGTELPFDSTLHRGTALSGINILYDWELLNISEQYYRLNPEPDYDLDNYFYIFVEIELYSNDISEILAITYNENRYIIHVKIDTWKSTGSTVSSYHVTHLIKISRSYIEEPVSHPIAEYYVSDHSTDVILFVIVDSLIIARIIFLKLSSRPVLRDFFSFELFFRDPVTNITSEDLDRREELADSIDTEE